MNPNSRGYQLLQKSLIRNDNQPHTLHELQPAVSLSSTLSTSVPDFMNISFTSDPADLSFSLILADGAQPLAASQATDAAGYPTTEPPTTGLPVAEPPMAEPPTTEPPMAEPPMVERPPAQQQDNTETTPHSEEMRVNDPEIHQMQALQQGKRKRQPEKWKANVKKTRRENGSEYIGRKYNEEGAFEEVIKPGKKMGERCGCKKKNCEIVSNEGRQEVFNYIWTLSNSEKAVFVKGLVDCIEPVEKKEGESQRSWSMQYHLRVSGARVRVCKKTFLSTTGLCNWWVHNVLTGGLGVAEVQRKRVREETGESKLLKEFLSDLPKLPSHYCRRDSSKLYLEPVFQSLQAVYRLYKEKCESGGVKVLSTFKFKEEFNAMNLSLFHPRKDRCDVCVGFEEGNVEEEAYNQHRSSAKRAQDEKASDKERSVGNPRIKCITMDLQSVLLCPRTNASALYYKTKLCVHNFTIYDLESKDCVCYVWNECEGALTANEFASCVVDFLSSDLTPDEYILYSDGCCYQNRNVTMSSALTYFSSTNGKTVTQKILQKGHTQMEVDSAHSTIERAFKNKSIYCPADYVRLMEESRKVKPYVVKYLTHDFFF